MSLAETIVNLTLSVVHTSLNSSSSNDTLADDPISSSLDEALLTSSSSSSSIPLNEPLLYRWDLDENSTHYDRMVASPGNEDRMMFWIAWSAIMAFTAIITTGTFIPLVCSKKIRQNPFHFYLIFLLVPDMVLAWLCGITCFTNALAGHFTSAWMCKFQSFYLIAAIGANSWMNVLVAYQLYTMLSVGRRFRRYKAPTQNQVFLHAAGVYLYAFLLASMAMWDAPWWPHKTRLAIGSFCIPMDYSTESTVVFYGLFFPALFGLPLVYVSWVAYQIYKHNSLPTQGRRRILTIYFFRLFAVFVVMWIPALLFMFVTSAWLDPWIQWAGGAWSHLQGVVSAVVSWLKPDVWKVVRNFWLCRWDGIDGESRRNSSSSPSEEWVYRDSVRNTVFGMTMAPSFKSMSLFNFSSRRSSTMSTFESNQTNHREGASGRFSGGFNAERERVRKMLHSREQKSSVHFASSNLDSSGIMMGGSDHRRTASCHEIGSGAFGLGSSDHNSSLQMLPFDTNSQHNDGDGDGDGEEPDCVAIACSRYSQRGSHCELLDEEDFPDDESIDCQGRKLPACELQTTDSSSSCPENPVEEDLDIDIDDEIDNHSSTHKIVLPANISIPHGNSGDNCASQQRLLPINFPHTATNTPRDNTSVFQNERASTNIIPASGDESDSTSFATATSELPPTPTPSILSDTVPPASAPPLLGIDASSHHNDSVAALFDLEMGAGNVMGGLSEHEANNLINSANNSDEFSNDSLEFGTA